MLRVIKSGSQAGAHNSTTGLQGGTTNEYYHLTSAQHTKYEGAFLGGVRTKIVGAAGAAITTGAKKAYVTIPYAGTISGVRLLADQAGDVVVDIWKDTYANFPPTVADTITAAAKPTLSSAQKYEDTTLTGWTTSVASGDILEFNIDSVATITELMIELDIDKTGV